MLDDLYDNILSILNENGLVGSNGVSELKWMHNKSNLKKPPRGSVWVGYTYNELTKDPKKIKIDGFGYINK